MSSNGHVVAATWSAADFADLDALNEPVSVDIFEGKKPPVIVDPRGYEQFVYLGDLGNPLVAEAVAAYQTQQRTMQREPDRSWVDQAIAIRGVNDKVLAAILIAPKYCPKERLVNGRPPPGQLWWGSFTDTQRRQLVDFWHSGVEALKPFRAAAPPDADAPPASDGVSSTAQPSPDPASPAVGPVVPERSGPTLVQRAGTVGEDGSGQLLAFNG
jgi:hypothetical protein